MEERHNDYNGLSTINFNRFTGNTATTGDTIDNNGDTIDATLNWWGTNTPNTNQNDIIGANYNPWIILTINASPTTIYTGDTSTITADLLHDNNGIYHNPLNGVIPYINNVQFTTTLGTINNNYMTNGITTTTLTTNSNTGTATLTAAIDNQIVQTNVKMGNPIINNQQTKKH